MKIELTPVEARVIGCLIEKAITTPDQYPLSLNALVNACNQKSNRDPMMDLDERSVQGTLDGLAKKHFVMEKSGFGSRVPKYQHRFCNTEFGTLKLDPQELAIICELLLRGPQTPGELRTRASRMAPLTDVSEVEAALTRLANRADGPFVTRLARLPGRRDSQYAQLFGGPVTGSVAAGEDVDNHHVVRGESNASAHRTYGDSYSGTAAPPHRAGADIYSAARQHVPPAALSEENRFTAVQSATVPAPEVSFPALRDDQRLAKVEQEVLALRAELQDLKRRLGEV
jgi:uncharacterized protein YceH (UPF0502 family)